MGAGVSETGQEAMSRAPHKRDGVFGNLGSMGPLLATSTRQKNFQRPKQFLFDKLNNIARPLARPHKDRNQGK